MMFHGSDDNILKKLIENHYLFTSETFKSVQWQSRSKNDIFKVVTIFRKM